MKKTIILILTIFFLFTGTGICLQEPPPSQRGSGRQEQKQASKINKKSDYDQRGTKNVPLVVEIIPSGTRDEPAKQKTANEQEKSFYDQLTAYSTAALAVITASLAWFTLRLWKSTGRLVTGTEQTAKYQLRAYVFVGLADGEKLFFNNKNGCLSAPFIIKNYGQTPAYHLKSSIFMGLYKLPLSKELDPPDYTSGSIGIVAPTQILRQYPALPCKLSPTEEAAIRNRICGIFVWGYVEYVDIFKDRQTAQFRMLSAGDDFDRGELAYCEEGNEAT